MRFELRAVALRTCCFVALVLFSTSASAADIDCLKCHVKLTKGSVLHAAVSMGCAACHTGIDARTVPHKKQKGAMARGLSAEQPDLCYGCHAREAFGKKTVHAALAMGCTSCHNPHSSNTPKLLIAEAPELCFTCHDKSLFSKKNVHAPVAGGLCLTCHAPHSSDEVALLANSPLPESYTTSSVVMALLVNSPYSLCLTCHDTVATKPHVLGAFPGNRKHPVGPIKEIPKVKEKKKKRKKQDPDQELASVQTATPIIIMDPLRPDRQFYCGSCHDPHSSDSLKLFRFKAKNSMDICINCHKMKGLR